MVVTKVFQIKNTNKLKQGLNYIDDKDKIKSIEYKNEEGLIKKIEYIINEQKTKNEKNLDNYTPEFLIDEKGDKNMVSCYGLSSVKYGFEEMMETKEQAKQFLGNRNKNKVDVLAHHIIQSFSPDDNLTPEEIHEIGRKTVLELTGGEHEFIIATHLDKEHLHNHIIFNTTNNITLKKFRWEKGTKKSLENISDKHADFYGAKIIDREKIIEHKKYEAYKKQNTFRYDLKQRLNFIMKNSNSLEDFVEKAKLLNVEMLTTGKEIKYKLLDTKQERYIRDGTLSKKGYYSLENINKVTMQNFKKVPKEDITKLYKEHIEEKEDDFEIRFIIEDWQVVKETNRGIYVDVEFGFNNKGLILIANQKFDKVENGYEVFIKRSDYFYFINSNKATENKYIKGSILSKQLSNESGNSVMYKNYYVSKIENLIKEFNYLSENNVVGYDTFIEFQERIEKRILEVEKEIDRLDSKIAELYKLNSALSLKDGNKREQELSNIMFEKLKISKTINKEELEKLLGEVIVERDILKIKLKEVIGEYKHTKNIEKNVEKENQNKKILVTCKMKCNTKE